MSRIFTNVSLAFALLAGTSLARAVQQLPAAESAAHQAFLQRLTLAALDRPRHSVRYVSEYVRIPYPGGDVPADTGVCTDEIIRIYRAVGIDLQKEVHEDMLEHFAAYPHRWNAASSKPDSNIDHRRVPNLMVFFVRKGASLPATLRAEDYSPGDLVTWDLGGGVPHIGMVVNRLGSENRRYMILHNIGEGPRIEDVLFRWKITGHYRYFGPSS
ncbi:MAG: DUF1287 domain-containing protein [Candidatus Acidiferrales bacterium]